MRRGFYRLVIIVITICVLTISVALVSARFMPRGLELAYMTEVDGLPSIYLQSIRHGLAYPLTTNEVADRMPLWSPDGTMMVYESQFFRRFNLYLMILDDASQDDARRLTVNVGGDGNAIWLPDRTDEILYVSSPGTINSIYRMNVYAQPLDHDRVTDFRHSAYAPSVSEQANEVLYVSIRDGQYDIFAMNLSTGEERRVTDDRYIDSYPAWSPDGTRFVYHSYQSNGLNIMISEPSGAVIRQITSERAQHHGAAWSPDGRFIAFTSNRDGNEEIYVIEVDNPDNLMRLTYHPAADRNPVWSPDGQYVAFLSFRDRNAEIYLARPNQGVVRRVTNHPGQDDYPAWRPQ